MRRLALPLVLVLAACGSESAFTVTKVTPPRFAAALGETLTLEGTGLDRLSAVALQSGSRVAEARIEAVEPERARIVIAPGLESGRWDLLARGGEGDDVTLQAALEAVTGEFQLEVVNIGQGDGGYVRAPDGTTLVIDGGRARVRGGDDSIAPVLERRGLLKPEYMLVSHFDADHLGGIVDFLLGPDDTACTNDDRVPTMGLLDYAPAKNTCNSALCSEYYRMRECNASRIASGRGWSVPAPGTRIDLGTGVKVRVVALNGELDDDTVVATGSDNSNSIALLIEFGRFRYLTAGDLTGAPQDDCEPGGDTADVEGPLGRIVGPVDVLHVNHHGSCTSTSQAFVDAVQPTVALVSVGLDNSYGHPAQQVVDRLDAAGTKLFLTTAGMTRPRGATPATTLPASAHRNFGHLRLRSTDGRNYTVEVLDEAGAPRSTTTFESRTP